MDAFDDDGFDSESDSVSAQIRLEKDIRTGRFKAGEKLPSQRDLATHYGVEKSTMQTAVGNLTIMGLVRTEQGRGTYVSPQHVSDLVRSGELSSSGPRTASSPTELIPGETEAIERYAGNRVAELVGLFFLTVGDLFGGAGYVSVHRGNANETVIEWSGGPTLMEVVEEVTPHEGKAGRTAWRGTPGLRLVHLGGDEVEFMWIPNLPWRLVLRRKPD